MMCKMECGRSEMEVFDAGSIDKVKKLFHFVNNNGGFLIVFCNTLLAYIADWRLSLPPKLTDLLQ